MNYVKFSAERATIATQGSGNFGENQRYESTKINLELFFTPCHVPDAGSKCPTNHH
ncbi:MAG: hypothetical protein RLZZ357_649 [Bacteroidota bacterium]|jgi:hypothetical protein